MSDSRTLLDPTSEEQPAERQLRARPTTLEGLTVGILDISKSRGNIFLDQIDELLSERGISIRRYAKPTFARVAPLELKTRISNECDIVIEGLAD
jgi:hypothetical protein